MREISIRPVNEADSEDLNRLYALLDSCNANPSQVTKTIQSTRDTLSGKLSKLSLVAEDTKSKKILGSGSLIWKKQLRMYVANGETLNLQDIQGNILEFASMIVLPEARGQGIGRAISEVRARFARAFEPDWLLAEFLPYYPNPEEKNTLFWEEIILPQLKNCAKLEDLKKACSSLLGLTIQNDTELAEALSTKLGSQARDSLVRQFFPQVLHNIPHQLIGSIGSKTKPALNNLHSIYQDQFHLAGYFPIDGGQNYLAPGNSTPDLKIPFDISALNFTTNIANPSSLPISSEEIEFDISA